MSRDFLTTTPNHNNNSAPSGGDAVLVPGYNFVLDSSTDWSRAVPPSRRLQAQQPPEETDPGALANKDHRGMFFNFPLPALIEGVSPARQKRGKAPPAAVSFDVDFSSPPSVPSSFRQPPQRQPQQVSNHPATAPAARLQQQASKQPLQRRPSASILLPPVATNVVPATAATVAASLASTSVSPARLGQNSGITSTSSSNVMSDFIVSDSAIAATAADARRLLESRVNEESRRLDAFRQAREAQRRRQSTSANDNGSGVSASSTNSPPPPPPPATISALLAPPPPPSPPPLPLASTPAMHSISPARQITTTATTVLVSPSPLLPPAGTTAALTSTVLAPAPSFSSAPASDGSTFNRLFGDGDVAAGSNSAQRRRGTPPPSSVSPALSTRRAVAAAAANNGRQQLTAAQQAALAAAAAATNNNNGNASGGWQISDFTFESLSALSEQIGSVSTGLSQKQLSRYKPHPFSRAEWKKKFGRGGGDGRGGDEKKEDGEELVECSVCLETIVDGNLVLTLPCSHVFHGACLLEALSRRNTCPNCRLEIARERGT